MNEKIIKYAAVGIGILLCLIGYFVWQSGNVSNNGNGADAVRNEFKQAGKSIDDAQGRAESIEAGLDRSTTAITNGQSAIGSSLERINSIQERTATIEAGLDEVERELGESQSIVRSVRERGRKDSKSTH